MAKAARLVICLDNKGYEVSLERRKIYVAVPDAKAKKLGQLRVVDESGADYLYPAEMFIAAELPQSVRRAVLQAA
jgi:RNA polymerase-interacting CarD/CdnL/TRCF family regulator